MAKSIISIKELHAHLIRTHHHKDPSSISEVIKSYALNPPTIVKAHLVFNQIERPTWLIWNYLIRGFSQSEKPRKAIDLYHRMHHQGLLGNYLTFIFVFKACARASDIVSGQRARAHVLKLGFESNLFVSNSLIHMYASCGDTGSARKVFDEMGERDLISWNSLICGYTQCNRFKEVLGLFRSMQEANVKADGVTMMKVILACSFLGKGAIADDMVKHIEENHIPIDVYLGNTIIDMYGRRGLVDLARRVFDQMKERNIVSWNAMIMGYGKIGNLVASRELFNNMSQKDVISWTSMIVSYCQAKQFTEALWLFKEMMTAKVKPDEITVTSVLSACAHLGSLDMGEAIHDHVREHAIKMDVHLGNSLIDMYCKCGVIEKAMKVFREMNVKDSISWTSVISGLAVNGFADFALELFSQMLEEGVQPTHGTFVGILLACAHAGLVEKGLEYFETMESVYGLKPEMRHYGCVVDLWSRFGNLNRAYDFIKRMPIAPDAVLWRILLSACNVHGNVALAEVAKMELLELDPLNSVNYILSSHTYAGIDRWKDVIEMRGLMEEYDMQKPHGSSSIEITDLASYNSQEPCLV